MTGEGGGIHNNSSGQEEDELPHASHHYQSQQPQQPQQQQSGPEQTLHYSNYLKIYSLPIRGDSGGEIAQFFIRKFGQIPDCLYRIDVRLGYLLLARELVSGTSYLRKFAANSNTSCYNSLYNSADGPYELVRYFNNLGSLKEYADSSGKFQRPDSSSQLIRVNEAIIFFWAIECEADLLDN